VRSLELYFKTSRFWLKHILWQEWISILHMWITRSYCSWDFK